jgi:hypothetical protein
MLYQCGRDNTSLLADRRLRRLAIALIASGAADASLPVALSFAVLRVTGSAGRLGLVLAAQSGVALLLTLAGGVAGDRFPRSRILAASLSVRAVMAAALAGALLTRTASFGLLLGLAGGYGCADGFFGPASTAVLPEVVPAGRLARANALIGGSTSVARIAAPAIAGTIVAAFGPGAGFAVQAAVLAVAVAALLAAHLASARPTASGSAADDPAADGPAIRGPGEQAPGVLGQLRSGWAEFARLRWLWLLTGQWAVYSMVILAPVSVLGPLIAERSLGGAAAWGIIGSCLSLGAVAGQLAASRVRFPARPAFAIAWLMPLMTAEALALGLGAPLDVVAVAGVVTGLAFGAQAVFFQTAMQVSVPPDVLARVTAYDLLGSEAAQPAGYALAGPVGAAVGPHAYLAVSGAAMLLASLAFTALPPLRAPATYLRTPSPKA